MQCSEDLLQGNSTLFIFLIVTHTYNNLNIGLFLQLQLLYEPLVEEWVESFLTM